ncbi:MAG: phosphoenolpyruvate--protein phosphotransferase [Candidatus Omnitrophica bacterium]|nr:phosphoenolpyruvate--protein phosphotransferase [Candidatus Omnitrophota bacterium]
MNAASNSDLELRGLAVSLGITRGPAYVLREEGMHFPAHSITPSQVDHEIERLDRAFEDTIRQIEQLISKQAAGEKQLVDEIVDFHHMLAKDIPRYTGERTKKLIRENLMYAETAFHKTLQDLIGVLGRSVVSRDEDVADIGQQILRNLTGKDLADFEDIEEPVILIAEDLSPSLTARLPRDKVLAFATTRGSRTSHTAIMARALEIPAVVGLPSLVDQVQEGVHVIVDGDRGRVIVNPSERAVLWYDRRKEASEKRAEDQLRYRTLPGETTDGFILELKANIELPEEVEAILAYGGDGIGLYRTEFLFMNRSDLPTEEEQFTAYRAVVESMAPKPVTIRTLDIGGDKFLTSFSAPKEMNPFMGWRAIRFCLEQPEIFGAQLRAILRASHYGNLSIMFPMIAEVRELRLALVALENAKTELRERGIPFNEEVEIGAMIEVPSAALVMEGLAPLVDFFSIGTNDLVQYTMAADRGNERTAYLYDPLHPGVLKLIQNVVEVAHAAGKKVSVCGEMAAEIEFTLLLVGMRLDELSMSPIAIPAVKRLIRSISLLESVPIADDALSMTEPEMIRDYLNEKTRHVAPWTVELFDSEEIPA